MARRPGLPAGEAVGGVSVGGCCCPEEARQLACAGDDGHVVRLAAGAHAVIDAVQPLLCSVGDLQDVVGLALLAVLEGRADPWVASVVPGRLDQQPPCERRAGLRDRPLAR